MVVEEGGCDRKRWGTWEELVLGGAVLRHGSQAWDVVASELQTRTIYPHLFTPQECKAKYDDLLERYSGSSAWFEELKKRRVDELRRALEKSEDSIGSLESKLESLKVEGVVHYNTADYSSSRAESPVFLKSEGNECSGREASKDGSSAGSFTHETETTWSPQCQVVAEASTEKAERKPVILEPCRLEKFPSIDKLAKAIHLEQGVSIRRKRGKRRRKDLSKDAKEGSVGENNLLGAVDSVCISQGKEKLTTDCCQPAGLPDVNDQNPCTSKQEVDDFTKILESIFENQHASVFSHRLDSQKRARYKKIIRQHMDLDTIRSRIVNRSITSSVELLRDLLLLANNALVFYSKCTREYKCALVLRNLVKKLRHHHHHPKAICSSIITAAAARAPAETPKSPPVRKPPAKPRSARPFNRKVGNKTVKVEIDDAAKAPAPKEGKRPRPLSTNVGSPSSAESSVLTKKSLVRRGKDGCVRRGNAGIQAETPMKVRKRAKIK